MCQVRLGIVPVYRRLSAPTMFDWTRHAHLHTRIPQIRRLPLERRYVVCHRIWASPVPLMRSRPAWRSLAWSYSAWTTCLGTSVGCRGQDALVRVPPCECFTPIS